MRRSILPLESCITSTTCIHIGVGRLSYQSIGFLPPLGHLNRISADPSTQTQQASSPCGYTPTFMRHQQVKREYQILPLPA
jgi:hypothetical protein